MRFTSCGKTDTGRVREGNEDAFLLDEEGALFVVADGMGGHRGGEVASRLAVETIEAVMRHAVVPEEPEHGPFGPRSGPRVLGEKLAFAVRVAGQRIHDQARRDPRLDGMGTTVVALRLAAGHAAIASVGDSRVYLVRGDRIVQLTEDHSWVAELVRAGLLPPEKASTHPERNRVTRSVGYEADVRVDLAVRPVERGDLFVLVSDGVTNGIGDDEILGVVSTREPAEAADTLVAMANAAGGEDNATVLVVRVDDPGPRQGRVVDPVAHFEPHGLDGEESSHTPMPDE